MLMPEPSWPCDCGDREGQEAELSSSVLVETSPRGAQTSAVCKELPCIHAPWPPTASTSVSWPEGLLWPPDPPLCPEAGQKSEKNQGTGVGATQLSRPSEHL